MSESWTGHGVKLQKSIDRVNQSFVQSEGMDIFNVPPVELPTDASPSAAPTDEHALYAEFLQAQRGRVKQIWAIGGGKGGVGKSLIASSLSIALGRQGHKVVTIDLDLGGANLHTALGIDLPRQTLSDFFESRVASLRDCVSSTGIPNVEMISGAQDSVQVTNIGFAEKAKFFRAIGELDADYVVFDLGAGTHQHTIDFFLYADVGIISLLPEPTSIENAYRFIKGVFYRKLWLSPRLTPLQGLVRTAMDSKNVEGIRTPADLYREASKMNPDFGLLIKSELERFKLKLIVNQTRTQTDIDIGFSVKSVCKKYFGLDLDYVGYLDYDSAVWQSVRRKRPLMMEFPNAPLVSNVERIAKYLAQDPSRSR